MNLGSFYNIRHRAGDVLWALPIRFWEPKAKPYRVSVLNDCSDTDRHVYCTSDQHDHPFYISREFLFYNLDNAAKAIRLLSKLYRLVGEDGVDQTLINIKNQERRS